MTTQPGLPMVEMQVIDVRKRPAGDDKPAGYVIVLEEVGGECRLPIWVGPFEGASMALHLEKVQTGRPLTYAFMANLLQSTGARLVEVLINRISEDTFYAVAVVDVAGRTETVDARPSDALNLALITGAPIRVEASLLKPNERPEVRKSIDSLWSEGTRGAAQIVEEMGGGPGFGGGTQD